MITVDDVEKELEVSLPQPYRNFLTKNGEGETIWADDPIYNTEWIILKKSVDKESNAFVVVLV